MILVEFLTEIVNSGNNRFAVSVVSITMQMMSQTTLLYAKEKTLCLFESRMYIHVIALIRSDNYT